MSKSKKIKIVHVRKKGSGLDYYYGSISAVHLNHTEEDIGADSRALTTHDFKNPFENSRVVIKIGELLTANHVRAINEAHGVEGPQKRPYVRSGKFINKGKKDKGVKA